MEPKRSAIKVIMFILITIALPYPAFLAGQYAAADLMELPRAISEQPVSMLIGFFVNLAIGIALYRYSMTSQRQQA